MHLVVLLRPESNNDGDDSTSNGGHATSIMVGCVVYAVVFATIQE